MSSQFNSNYTPHLYHTGREDIFLSRGSLTNEIKENLSLLGDGCLLLTTG
jgi:hypothetical protein